MNHPTGVIENTSAYISLQRLFALLTPLENLNQAIPILKNPSQSIDAYTFRALPKSDGQIPRAVDAIDVEIETRAVEAVLLGDGLLVMWYRPGVLEYHIRDRRHK